MAVQLTTLGPLIDAGVESGYRVGPAVRDGAIVLTELDCADALPYGWGVDTGPGRYRLGERGDPAAFGHAADPQSPKSFLHPARRALSTGERKGDGFTTPQPEEEPPRYAFLGVHVCDLHAIAVRYRLDRGYARRRAQLFILTVACTEPAEFPVGIDITQAVGALAAERRDR
jgi:hypothetical protein